MAMGRSSSVWGKVYDKANVGFTRTVRELVLVDDGGYCERSAEAVSGYLL